MRIQAAVASIILVAALWPVEATAKEEANGSSGRPCLAHFTGTGFKSWSWTHQAKMASTWQEFIGVSYDTAFRKVAQATAQRGFTNMNANKDIGTITAGVPGAGISIVVKEKAGGVVRVEATLDLQQSSFSAKDAQAALCASVEAPGE